MVGERLSQTSMRYRVVLVRPQGPINVGMIARLCANLGAELCLVAPQCDVQSMDAKMFAHHAQPLLERAAIYEHLQDAIRDCQLSFATSARPRRTQMQIIPPESIGVFSHSKGANHIALVFGNEQDGLSQEDIERCDAIIQLETPGEYHSYNLSQAVGIVLYIATTSREPENKVPDDVGASVEQREFLLDAWQALLEERGYFRRSSKEEFEPKLRALISRLSLREHDLQLLMSMFTLRK
jgi:tRNA/rRNA methyltransferase